MRENYEGTVIESQICRNICVIPLRWAVELSLTEKHDSYSMFVWNLECTFKTCKSENKNLLVYSGLVHLPDTPTMKWTRPLLYILGQQRTQSQSSNGGAPGSTCQVYSRDVLLQGMWQIIFKEGQSLSPFAHSQREKVPMPSLFKMLQPTR